MDFEEIKAAVRKWVDSKLDHKMISNARDPLVKVLRGLGEPVVAVKGNPTAESTARLICDHARKEELPVAPVRLRETVNSFAEYGGWRQGAKSCVFAIFMVHLKQPKLYRWRCHALREHSRLQGQRLVRAP